MAERPASAVRLLSPLVPLVAALVVWWPLPDTFFYADDFLHLFDLVTLGLPRFLLQVWGGHLYVVRNAVFAAMYAGFGPEPRPWFWSVLLTHLLNVLLLHRTIRRMSGDRLLACLGATLWGTSPALEGTLGWYSVYGQVLLTTIVLVVLSSLAGTTGAREPLSVRRAIGWAALLAAGAACFGTGLGLLAAFPVVALVAFPREQWSVRPLVLLVLIAVAVFAVYAVLRADSPALDERTRALLAPASIVDATPTIVTFAGALLGFGARALLLDPLGLDTWSPNAAALVAATIVVGIVVAGWLAADTPGRRRLGTMAILVVAAYATIAGGRATILLSVDLPIGRAAAWPRYHYLPMALQVVLVCVALAAVRARRGAPRTIVTGVAALCLTARLVLLAIRPVAVDHHDAERTETETVLRDVRQAVAAAAPGTVVTIPNRPFGSAQIPALFPGWAGLFVIYFPENTLDGHPVRFAATGGAWTLAQARGGRIAELVVQP